MPHKVNFGGVRARAWAFRLKIAQWVAPPGADIHDPDNTACPEAALLLNDVFFGQVENRGDEHYADVTAYLEDLDWRYGLVEQNATGYWLLTEAGERELDRRWGPGRVAPWSSSLGSCEDHGDFDQLPGDWIGCPKCPLPGPRKRRHERGHHHTL